MNGTSGKSGEGGAGDESRLLASQSPAAPRSGRERSRLASAVEGVGGAGRGGVPLERPGGASLPASFTFFIGTFFFTGTFFGSTFFGSTFFGCTVFFGFDSFGSDSSFFNNGMSFGSGTAVLGGAAFLATAKKTPLDSASTPVDSASNPVDSAFCVSSFPFFLGTTAWKKARSRARLRPSFMNDGGARANCRRLAIVSGCGPMILKPSNVARDVHSRSNVRSITSRLRGGGLSHRRFR